MYCSNNKNPEILKFVYDQLKIKQICKRLVNKLLIIIRYVPNRYNTQ